MYIDQRLRDVLGAAKRILPYIDIPLQHASDAMLKRMSRKTTRALQDEILGSLRESIESLVLRTTMITGFPGETEEDFQQLVDFVEQQRFEHLGVFTYSVEEDTPAAKLPNRVSAAVAQRRMQELMATQQSIAFDWNEGRVGTTEDVIIDAALPEQEGVWIGRTKAEAPDIDGGGLCVRRGTGCSDRGWATSFVAKWWPPTVTIWSRPRFSTPPITKFTSRSFRSSMSSAPRVSASSSPPRLVAVIDIGATAIRMAIAELRHDGEVRTLDTLVQPVNLGREAFESRRLSRKNIEKTASILSQYQRVLLEYGIVDPNQVRVVATSAVREASNRLAFTDRIFVVTGLSVEPIDEAEVNRITYMGITPQLRENRDLDNGKTVVVEVGGGSTELLVVRSGNVLTSESYRLGSLRMLKTLEKARTGTKGRRPILENHILRSLKLIDDTVSTDGGINLVAVGGDIRIAAHWLVEEWPEGALIELEVDQLAELTDEILSLSEDAIVKRYGVSFIEAETLGPALLSYSMLSQHFGLGQIYVSDTNLRDGLLHDMAVGGSWTAEFRNQIVRSAISMGREFHFDEMHARNVAELSRKLFDQLSEEHKLDNRHEVILHIAALLHEIGMQINVRSHHKHALYIIKHGELFGLSKDELLQVGLVARYYRRAAPQPEHTDYMSLSRDDRVVVCKLAAILRLAAALDDTRSGRIREIECVREGSQLVINVPGLTDVSLEKLAMQQGASLFRDVYGTPVQLRAGR